MICVSISHPGQIGPALEAGTRLLEFRFDLMGIRPDQAFAAIGEGTGTVATCRPGAMDESGRIRILQEAIHQGASYVDLELEMEEKARDSLVREAREKGCSVILSHHDFASTPEKHRLEEILQGCFSAGADVAKIAVRIRARQDLHALLSLYAFPGRKVVLGMGPLGRITRVAAPYLGAEFTFASLSEEERTAPGQLTLRQLKSIYNLMDEA